MRGLLIVIALLGACAKKGPGLAERVRASILASVPGVTVTVADPKSLVVGRGELQHTLNLDNLELKCASGADACAAAIDRVVANARDLLDGPQKQITADRVMLTLKSPDWLAQADSILKRDADKYEDNRLVTKALAGDLTLVLAIDWPNGIQMASVKQMRDLELDSTTAFELARKNLLSARPMLKVSEMSGTGIYTNDEDDDYITSLMAAPERWKPLADRLKGNLVVACPARNRIFATDTTPAHVKALATMTREALAKQSHPLSGVLFRWSMAGWTPLKP